MCGIAGIVTEKGRDCSRQLRAMTAVLAHRGPDAEGFYCERDQGVFLGHRRLSILDLDARANQPMVSEDSRYVVVYNGEIYNFVELRRELEAKGREFQTTSDTEVIHHAYAEWGSACFARFRGMFALGLYDTETEELVLARDPLGIKPLYYHDGARAFSFASEARALLAGAPGRERFDVDTETAGILLAHSYLPGSDETIIHGINRVAPGTILHRGRYGTRIERYWTLERDPGWEGLALDETCERFEELLLDTVRIMLRSDVPLSFLLSGGVDSSLVVALAHELGVEDLRTFTAVFGHELDEGGYAERVAKELGTRHEELRIEVGDAADEMVAQVGNYDDLSSTDGGLFTTALVSRKIAEHGLKVTFVGEGADEILGGYSWFGLSQLPYRLMPLNLRALGCYYAVSRLAHPRYWKNSRRVASAFRQSGERDILRQVSAYEVNMQLPNHLLQKVDRGTMSASIEARVPFMDHEVVTAAYSMPAGYKRRGSWFSFSGVQEKYISRVLVEKRLPREIAWRKKRGFMLPVADMIVENREFVRDTLLAHDSLAREFMDAARIEKMIGFRKTMYHPVEKEKEVLTWRLLLLSLWHRHSFRASSEGPME